MFDGEQLLREDFPLITLPLVLTPLVPLTKLILLLLPPPNWRTVASGVIEMMGQNTAARRQTNI